MRTHLIALMLFIGLALGATAQAASVEELAVPREGDRTLWTFVADTLDTHAMAASGAAASLAELVIATAFSVVIDNVFYTCANATYDISAMGNNGTITAQPVSTYCRYVFTLDTDEDVDVFPGETAASAALAAYPSVDEGVCPFASVLVATDSTATFTLGTTNFAGAGATSTFEDLYALPTQAIDR